MAKFHSKTKEYREQMGRVFRSFFERPKTMLDVSIETGILRANICRYVSHMEDDGKIQIHHKGIDPTTKCRAAFYTTNPELFNQPEFTQMSLFWRALRICHADRKPTHWKARYSAKS